MSYFLGLMSGTSRDGIDVAIVDLPAQHLLAGRTIPYSQALKAELVSLCETATVDLGRLCQLNTLIGREFAEAALSVLAESGLSAQAIRAIGSHGQTVIHNTQASPPYTLQLGCPHTIAARTGIEVVADFRSRDLIAGGQGAPFAPLYHQALFADPSEARAVVNLGGIANISLLEPGKPVRGWDLGPANCLMDSWTAQNLGRDYDANGQWAASGEVIEELLAAFMADPFIRAQAPKSIGREYFSLAWLEQFNPSAYKPEDVQASLLAMVVESIALVLDSLQVRQLFLCGGGAHNQYFVERLSLRVPEIGVQSIDALGYSADYLEAMLFAWLAAKRIAEEAVDLSAITGSTTPLILGALYR